MKLHPISLGLLGLLLGWGAGAGAQTSPTLATARAAQVTPAAAIPAEGLTVAVFDFTSRDATLEDAGAMLADLIRTQLSGATRLRLVTREDLKKILEEQKLALAGVTEEASPQVGKLLGAQVLVLGRMFRVNGDLVAMAKVIGVETSRVYSETATGPADKLGGVGQELGRKVANLIEKGGETLLARVHLNSAQLAELKKKLAGQPLPRVFVYVREQVVNLPVPDPAAQTEISYILKKLGCEVVKERGEQLTRWADAYLDGGNRVAPPRPGNIDMVLIGEGISQFASRTGDLVSSRARVELEALDPKTGKALAVDRETFVGVDLSEQIAAKSALQEAASRLALRIIPDAVEGWRSGAPVAKHAAPATTGTLEKK